MWLPVCRRVFSDEIEWDMTIAAWLLGVVAFGVVLLFVAMFSSSVSYYNEHHTNIVVEKAPDGQTCYRYWGSSVVNCK